MGATPRSDSCSRPQGAAGAVAALAFGRVDSRGRERQLLALPMLGMAGALWIIALPSLAAIVLALAIVGFLNGPMDVALFTIRQRRTPPAWTGRAFAVSMSLNFAGYPLGSVIAGALGTDRIELAVAIAVIAVVAAALIAWVWIPQTAEEPGSPCRPDDVARSGPSSARIDDPMAGPTGGRRDLSSGQRNGPPDKRTPVRRRATRRAGCSTMAGPAKIVELSAVRLARSSPPDRDGRPLCSPRCGARPAGRKAPTVSGSVACAVRPSAASPPAQTSARR